MFHTAFAFRIQPIISSWGLNASGQLGLGSTDDVGAEEGTMGDALPAVQPGLRLAFPPSPVIALDEESGQNDTTSSPTTAIDEGSSLSYTTPSPNTMIGEESSPEPTTLIDEGSSPDYTTPSPTTAIDEGPSSDDTTPIDTTSSSSDASSVRYARVIPA